MLDHDQGIYSCVVERRDADGKMGNAVATQQATNDIAGENN